MIKPTGSVPSRSSGEGAGGSLDRELAPEKAWFAAFDAWGTEETSFNFPRCRHKRTATLIVRPRRTCGAWLYREDVNIGHETEGNNKKTETPRHRTQ